MDEKYFDLISRELGLQKRQVVNTLTLLKDGATIPFISRYRKEMTGQLDEIQIGEIKKSYEKLLEIDQRRETIITAIEKAEKMTDDLRAKLLAAKTLNELEDLYLPYKQKRKTRAAKAKENGLEPLAKIILQEKILILI